MSGLRSTLTHARRLFYGNIRHPNYEKGARGLEIIPLIKHVFGTPVAGAANAHCTTQALNVGAAVNFNGSAAGVNDIARNIVAAWTNTAVITVTGLDFYGERVVESSASGTSFVGKKAMKSLISVAVSANVTGLTVGNGNVLGLPFRCIGKEDMLRFTADGADELAAATVAAAVATTPTATTGDVRGTIAPNTTPNGSVRFAIWMRPVGVANNAEAFGVPQFAG
jgi:hypothetical protein